jgi:uncharacterized membrane-anchored protein
MPNLLNANAKLRKERNDLPSLLAVWFLVLHCLRSSSLLLVSSSSPCLWVPLVLVLAKDEGLRVTTLNLSLCVWLPLFSLYLRFYEDFHSRKDERKLPLFSLVLCLFLSFLFLFFVFCFYFLLPTSLPLCFSPY